jgi:hypothetical protein
MRPEDEILFACTRQVFGVSHKRVIFRICKKNAISWERVFTTSEEHGVAPLVYANLIQNNTLALNIPPEVVHKFRLYVYRAALRKEMQDRRLLEALAFFQERCMEVMLIKGAAFDFLIYNRPWVTDAKDIDLILHCKRDSISEEAFWEIQHFLYGSRIEYDFYEHHDVNINGALRIDFDRIWDEARWTQYHGYWVSFMPFDDMLITACINSCRKRFFRLKSLCDIAEIAERLSLTDWDQFCQKARQYNCANIVFTALYVTQKTLGGKAPDDLAKQLQVNPLRAGLLRLIVHLLMRNTSLDAYPYSGIHVLGKQIHPALILPYTTYQFDQIQRRIGETIRGR